MFFYMFSLVKAPKVHVELITPRASIKIGGFVELQCSVEGMKSIVQ